MTWTPSGWNSETHAMTVPTTWRERADARVLQALDTRLYQEGNVELERMAFPTGRGQTRASTKIATIEFLCAKRGAGQALGPEQTRYLGARDEATQVRLFPRNGGQ